MNTKGVIVPSVQQFPVWGTRLDTCCCANKPLGRLQNSRCGGWSLPSGSDQWHHPLQMDVRLAHDQVGRKLGVGRGQTCTLVHHPLLGFSGFLCAKVYRRPGSHTHPSEALGRWGLHNRPQSPGECLSPERASSPGCCGSPTAGCHVCWSCIHSVFFLLEKMTL